jgi:class 3 adenylate cyclase
MVELIDKVETVLLSVRWHNVQELIDKPVTSDEVLSTARLFLGAVENGIRAKDGEIKHSVPDQVTAMFAVSGKISDVEMRAIEAARRILMEIRRHNMKQPPVPLHASIAVIAGTVLVAPGIAEVGLNSLVLGSILTTVDRMLRSARPDNVVVGTSTYDRIGFMYKGRPVDGPLKMAELIL